MLYWLLVPLKEYVSFLNVFRYITVRTFLAGSTALLLSLILGRLLIKLLKKLQIGEEIREQHCVMRSGSGRWPRWRPPASIAV